MSMSPPLSEGTASPVFENGPPVSRGGDLIDEVRNDFGFFNENLEHELELENDHRHVESTPKMINVPLNRFDLKPKDSPGNYEKKINLVKETSIAYEQNKKLKDLSDLEDLKREIYNQPKPIKPQKPRVDWDPSVKMGESSNTYSKEPLKPSQDYKIGKRKSFNYPTPPIFDPKTSNADQFVSTFNNFAD